MEGTSSSGGDPGKRTRLTEKKKQERLEEKKKLKKEKVRQNKLFQPSKVIGPNDMVVNTTLNKIKLEPEGILEGVVVKEEPEENIGEEMVPESCDEGEFELRVVKSEVDFPVENATEIQVTVKEETLKSETPEATNVEGSEEVPNAMEGNRVNLTKSNFAEKRSIGVMTEEGKKSASCKDLAAEDILKQEIFYLRRELMRARKREKTLRKKLSCVSDRKSHSQKPVVKEKMLQLLSKIQAGRREQLKMSPFELVLESIVNHDNKWEDNEQIFDWEFKRATLKKCRLICREWKLGVDQVLQHHPSHFRLRDPLQLQHYTGSPCPLFILVEETGLSLDTTEGQVNFGKYLLSLKDSPQETPNPLPTRHLVISQPRNFRPFTMLWLRLFEYVRVLGPHVWNLHLCLSSLERGYPVTAELLRIVSLLSYFPNLRCLSLDTSHVIVPYKPPYCTPSGIGYLKTQDWCPIWKGMVILQTDIFSPFLPSILQKNPHISKLGVLTREDLPVPETTLPLLPLSNLKHLSFACSSITGWERLSTAENLESLQLTVTNDQVEYVRENFAEIVKALQNFSHVRHRVKITVLAKVSTELEEMCRFVFGPSLSLESLSVAVPPSKSSVKATLRRLVTSHAPTLRKLVLTRSPSTAINPVCFFARLDTTQDKMEKLEEIRIKGQVFSSWTFLKWTPNLTKLEYLSEENGSQRSLKSKPGWESKDDLVLSQMISNSSVGAELGDIQVLKCTHFSIRRENTAPSVVLTMANVLAICRVMPNLTHFCVDHLSREQFTMVCYRLPHLRSLEVNECWVGEVGLTGLDVKDVSLLNAQGELGSWTPGVPIQPNLSYLQCLESVVLTDASWHGRRKGAAVLGYSTAAWIRQLPRLRNLVLRGFRGIAWDTFRRQYPRLEQG